jgi:hypothetical protein
MFMRIEPVLALLLFTGFGSSCQSGGRGGSVEPARAPLQNTGASATSASAPERPPSLLSESVVDIRPEGTVRDLVFRFRGRTDLLDGVRVSPRPWIAKVFIGLPGHREPVCVVQGETPIAMNEWRYGATPEGFEKTGCAQLTAGEYVVSVRGLGAGGGIRIVVDKNGAVSARPLRGATEPIWDGR